MSDFIITRSSQAMVLPSKPTYNGNLPLSLVDKALYMRSMMELFQVFHTGHHPAKLIRQALAMALVPYYPVAGRLAEDHVACTGEGVLFSEATANCSLKDLKINLSQPLLIPVNDLLPTIDATTQDLILMIQVTEFTCGGFVVCFGYNHAVFDGYGIMNFFRAVGEIARGLEKPVIEPIWCREIIPGPPPPKPVAHPSSSSAIPYLHLEFSTLDIQLDKIKEGFMKDTGRTCSDFDVVVAALLQCRTRAINPEHAETLDFHLVCTSDGRPLLHELIPGYEGYYGNCTSHSLVTAPASKIMQATVTDIVGWILDAKERVSDEFWKWLRGEHSDKSITNVCNYETIVVTDVDELGSKDVNYGWGAPVQSGKLSYSDHMVYCMVDSSLKIEGGVRITGRLVREEHLQAFHDEMDKACN
ncbi:Benzyl alcohol O-benzoyltransferase protein [Dioscorea alata]|uniref:Benzyl alcohol O-benzoyltransferase protein n=3 Tax=Dioscorea alata TaxID=55571 RepID=A0ACB7TTI0_DIOAL|nr:Benzyl alcohol O-benzoyltransferase protein [Dioscorea alata]KAH7652055.1 Benzyl alcohol O-benzoyltransferase protein [Dioscorea alata]